MRISVNSHTLTPFLPIVAFLPLCKPHITCKYSRRSTGLSPGRVGRMCDGPLGCVPIHSSAYFCPARTSYPAPPPPFFSCATALSIPDLPAAG